MLSVIKKGLIVTKIFFCLGVCLTLERCHPLAPQKAIQKRSYKINRTNKAYVIKNKQGRYYVKPSKKIDIEEHGQASYYGKGFHGNTTASGKTFDMNAYTAAHKIAILPSVALVTYGNRTRIVLINDRGPFAKKRILDCSHRLARDLGFEREGIGQVKVKILKKETLALKENGGNITWDGKKPFPLSTAYTRPYRQLIPSKSKLDKPLKIRIKQRN